MSTLAIQQVKLGFSGLGWIGKSRLQAIQKDTTAIISCVNDESTELSEAIQKECGEATRCTSWQELLASEVDGIIIATPSALHAQQCIEALEHGKAVFCQKPLGRDLVETRRVIELAEKKNLLLEVDYSYRYTEAGRKIREVIHSGEIGEVFSASLTFHNAYGPDKGWYHDPRLSGGGCLIDLGIHLVDMLYWIFEKPVPEQVCSALYSKGLAFQPGSGQVEDFVAAQLQFNTGLSAALQCSWNLPAGQDAVIEASFYGSKGGVSMKNLGGSFYDFRTELMKGTQKYSLSEPPDKWGGRAAVDWAERLTQSKSFDPEIKKTLKVAETIDRIYHRKQ
ncbi:MAG: Gfo/Idh/MocA family protein [Cyclobacteriaceae bacterium]